VMTDKGPATNRLPSDVLADASRCGTFAPSPILPRRTAKPSASSRQVYGNGPMPKRTETLASDETSYRPGSIATTGI